MKDFTELEKIRLEKIRIGIVQRVSRGLLNDDAAVSFILDDFVGIVEMHLTGSIW